MLLADAERDRYLERIGCALPPRAELGTLAALQRAHLAAVPFENLDIHLGVPIELAPEALLAKLVARRRGGFCYELNGAFAALLAALGFRLRLCEARVFGAGGLGIRFDHLALVVELDGPYLVDVGFGECVRAPLALRPGASATDVGGSYRIEPAPGGALDLLRDGAPQYRLDPAPRTLADFEPGCRHHQTSPDSHFTRKPIVTRATETGRQTLSGLRWIETRGGEREEREFAPAELGPLLSARFGIELDPSALARLARAHDRTV